MSPLSLSLHSTAPSSTGLPFRHEYRRGCPQQRVMVYEATKPRLNRLRHSSVPSLEALILWSFTDRLSVRLDIRFMARTDAAKDHEDRSALVQNMQYTRIVPRILNPEFEKYSADRCDPAVGTRTIKRPREGFIKADESQNLEDLSHDDTKDISKSTRAMTRTVISGPFSKDSEESSRVSTKFGVLKDLQ